VNPVVKDPEVQLLRGKTPDFDALAGWEFRGTNLPAWASLVGIKHFIKGFYKDAAGAVWGYNRAPVQGSKRYGFYRVDRVDSTSRDNAYLHALLLDNGRGDNARVDPSRGLRDYLVQLDDDTFLGKAYYALGPLRVAASFFTLERLGRN
jgi:hypothetical protein